MFPQGDWETMARDEKDIALRSGGCSCADYGVVQLQSAATGGHGAALRAAVAGTGFCRKLPRDI